VTPPTGNQPARIAGSTTLVTGPVRSGKSRHAEHLLAHEPAVTYVATGRPADLADAEWTGRVEGHRVRRPMSWTTLETSDVVGVIASAEGPVLVDCLGTWLTALVDAIGWDDLVAAGDLVGRQRRALVEALCDTRVPVVIVTNEVGWSLVATTASGRFFQDELGRLNADVAAVAARVHLAVAGRVVDLSDAPVVPAALPPPPADA
jgi:adenosylcobinamide kinase/adenosylcobinamide-phosphate guanylyltransferase